MALASAGKDGFPELKPKVKKWFWNKGCGFENVFLILNLICRMGLVWQGWLGQQTWTFQLCRLW